MLLSLLATTVTCFSPSPAQPLLRRAALRAELGPANRLGEPWWIDINPRDAPPAAAPGLTRYLATMVVLALAMLGSLIVSARAQLLTWTTSTADVAASPVLGRRGLAVWRCLAALGVSGVSLNLALRETRSQLEDLDRRGRDFSYSGAWRFQGLTGWAWLLINVYFTLVACLTLAPTSTVPSAAACIAETLLGAAFAFSLLVTSVVTFVLIPSKQRAGLATDNL